MKASFAIVFPKIYESFVQFEYALNPGCESVILSNNSYNQARHKILRTEQSGLTISIN